MNEIYERMFGKIKGLSYPFKTGDWWVVVQKAWKPAFNDHDYEGIGPFATSEEAVANGKLQTIGRTYIFQIRDRKPK